jgi:pilus assembly protein Flp/PilA
MIRTLIATATAALKDRKGVTAAEYAVLATGIVVVVAGAASGLGTRITGVFSGLLAAAGGGGGT